MIITERTLTDKQEAERDYRQVYQLNINGEERFYVREGEPEDATLGRDFNDVYNIISLMQKAYDAGKNGEEFVVEHKFIEED